MKALQYSNIAPSIYSICAVKQGGTISSFGVCARVVIDFIRESKASSSACPHRTHYQQLCSTMIRQGALAKAFCFSPMTLRIISNFDKFDGLSMPGVVELEEPVPLLVAVSGSLHGRPRDLT